MAGSFSRIAVITGATSGIGEATARRFVAAGFAVQKKTGFGKKREMLTGSLVRPVGDAYGA